MPHLRIPENSATVWVAHQFARRNVPRIDKTMWRIRAPNQTISPGSAAPGITSWRRRGGSGGLIFLNRMTYERTSCGAGSSSNGSSPGVPGGCSPNDRPGSSAIGSASSRWRIT